MPILNSVVEPCDLVVTELSVSKPKMRPPGSDFLSPLINMLLLIFNLEIGLNDLLLDPLVMLVELLPDLNLIGLSLLFSFSVNLLEDLRAPVWVSC